MLQWPAHVLFKFNLSLFLDGGNNNNNNNNNNNRLAATTHSPTVFRVDRTKYQIQIPLPPKIDASVTMMTVEEKPDVTYSDIGGCKEQIDKMREVVELPMLHPEKFVALGIDPPKGVLCYGPPGTGQQTFVCHVQQFELGSITENAYARQTA